MFLFFFFFNDAKLIINNNKFFFTICARPSLTDVEEVLIKCCTYTALWFYDWFDFGKHGCQLHVCVLQFCGTALFVICIKRFYYSLYLFSRIVYADIWNLMWSNVNYFKIDLLFYVNWDIAVSCLISMEASILLCFIMFESLIYIQHMS